MGVHRTGRWAGEIRKIPTPENFYRSFYAGRHTTGQCYPHFKDALTIHTDTDGYAYAPRAVQSHPRGGQSDFVWLPARTPHGGASYVW